MLDVSAEISVEEGVHGACATHFAFDFETELVDNSGACSVCTNEVLAPDTVLASTVAVTKSNRHSSAILRM
ncbi:hypothetical protein A2T82_35920 (plasmid) [Burkholderia cenocepacia]|nr:hypothetical protein A2T82_35920 [Burkholderia cenocepacia]